MAIMTIIIFKKFRDLVKNIATDQKGKYLIKLVRKQMVYCKL